jgi:membrane associated rhomboid family serine protease
MIPIGDTRRRFGFPWMTLVMLSLCAVIFFFERRTSLAHSIFSLVPQDMPPGQHTALLFKALMCWLVQGPGWLEPIVNLVYLWVLGNKVEDACGPWGLLLITLLSSTTGVAVTMIVHPASADPVYGLAGVVAGLFGAYLVLYGFQPIPSWLPPFVARLTPVPVVLHLLYWAGLEFVNVSWTLLRSGKILQAFFLEPTWPFVSALVMGLIAAQLFARREYLYYRALQIRAARRVQQ